MNWIMTQTHSSNEHYDGECSFALWAADLGWVNLCLARIELFRLMRGELGQSMFLASMGLQEIHQMTYWGGNPMQCFCWNEYLEELRDDDGGLVENRLSKGHVVIFNTEPSLPSGVFQEIECEVVEVDYAGVRLRAIPKHTDVHVTTPELSYEILTTLREDLLEGR